MAIAEQWGKLLKSLGFTESESAIYLLSLEMGPSSVQNLARKARVSRVTTYAVIESLSTQGLMSSMQKGKKKLYAAESPERLLSFVGGRIKTMEATFRDVEQLLPDLKLLQRGEKPIVKFFEGKEGLKALRDDIIQTNPMHIDEFANRDAADAVLAPEDLHEYREWLKEIGVTMRFLHQASISPESRPGAEARRLLPGAQIFYGDIIIYGAHVAMATLKGKLILVIIESEELAQTMRVMFDLAWQASAQKKEA